ncbi:hypothetical protein CLV84_1835 [Neolewinella xylanilytica]|uniref:Uncharacterized protein n=1 Tax=Neolewinella xylanilytica TaxID=1514080 RepID=A0A2S6IBH5_9BACT|nr:hypothetical protein [Neolewinella xylanilytica]PPK88861.1 hypothetical protein CLV84_1835 [Neolewinella xylanilytica]
MERSPESKAKFHAALAWVPVLVYFVTKYLVFGNEMPRSQWWMLIAAVILAEIALWRYRRQALRNEPPHGTN